MVHRISVTQLVGSGTQRNRKDMNYGRVILLFGPLVAGSISAQVPNDDCANAQELDLIIFSPTCSIWGQPSQSLVDSTDLAIPNFPYPANPGACFGYWALPNVPANDRWYRFLLPSGDYVEYTCTALDSLQLSWWQGYDCAYLMPLDCSTLLPGETIHRLRPGSYHPGTDTLYLQVSSTSITSDARYELCYRDTWWGTTPITYGTALPTPVVCFPYQLDIAAAVEVTAQGGASLTLDDAYGPYTIVWSDGLVGPASRTDLPIGEHSVSVTSAIGCTEVIPFSITLDPSLTVQPTTEEYPRILQGQDGVYLDLGTDLLGPVTINLYDALGRLIDSRPPTTAPQVLFNQLPPGLHVAILRHADGSISRLTFVAIE